MSNFNSMKFPRTRRDFLRGKGSGPADLIKIDIFQSLSFSLRNLFSIRLKASKEGRLILLLN